MSKTLLSVVLGLLAFSLGPVAFAQTMCTMQYDPVCSTDGVTYGNACTASSQGKTIAYAGECKTGSELDQALKMAYQFGITKYNNLTDFRSESLVTREQIAKMMLQFAKAMNRSSSTGSFDCSFTDLNTTDATLTNYVIDACNQGMIKGWNQAFHPQDNVSYAQAITMMMRVMIGVQTEPEQRWTPYEQYAITKGYIKQTFGQPMGLITRGELIIWMNTIYSQTNESDTIYETWSIADTLANCNGEGPQTCMQVSRNGAKTGLFYDEIEGFNYVSGYHYILQVVGKKVDNPPADGSSLSWSLIKLHSSTSTRGKPDTLPQPGCDWVKIDNDTLSVWGQTCDATNNHATLSYDKNLPGVMMTTKQGTVTTQTPLVHIFPSPKATGLQNLLFNTHNSMIKQGLVDKSAACLFLQNTTIIGSSIERYDFVADATITGATTCGVYSYMTGSASYFIKPKTIFTTMIYINNNEQYRKYIDRGSLVIK